MLRVGILDDKCIDCTFPPPLAEAGLFAPGIDQLLVSTPKAGLGLLKFSTLEGCNI